MESVPHWFLIFFLTVVPAVIYIVPTIVAFGRQHRQKWAILGVNLALGWTLIAWLVALLWAFTRPEPK